MSRLYSRSRSCVFRWGADPAHCETVRGNPLDRLGRNFRDLHKAGATQVASAAADFLLKPLGARALPRSRPAPKREDVLKECLDDCTHLNKMHQVITAGGNPREVRWLAGKVRESLGGTVTLFERNGMEQNGTK